MSDGTGSVRFTPFGKMCKAIGTMTRAENDVLGQAGNMKSHKKDYHNCRSAKSVLQKVWSDPVCNILNLLDHL